MAGVFRSSRRKAILQVGEAGAARIEKYIAKNLESDEDPRRFGKPFLSIKNAWRYRIGDYRLVCQIQNAQLIVLIVKVGHRRDVYD